MPWAIGCRSFSSGQSLSKKSTILCLLTVYTPETLSNAQLGAITYGLFSKLLAQFSISSLEPKSIESLYSFFFGIFRPFCGGLSPPLFFVSLSSKIVQVLSYSKLSIVSHRSRPCLRPILGISTYSMHQIII